MPKDSEPKKEKVPNCPPDIVIIAPILSCAVVAVDLRPGDESSQKLQTFPLGTLFSDKELISPILIAARNTSLMTFLSFSYDDHQTRELLINKVKADMLAKRTELTNCEFKRVLYLEPPSLLGFSKNHAWRALVNLIINTQDTSLIIQFKKAKDFLLYQEAEAKNLSLEAATGELAIWNNPQSIRNN